MEQKKGIYVEIIRVREYRKMILSGMINRFGDSIDAIAFTWLVYQLTQSAAWSAIVYALNTLPNVVVQPFAGALVEKMNKKHVIVVTHLLRAIVIAAFACLYRAELVNPVVMAAFTLVITTIESVNLPAASAFTVKVVRKEHMTTAMSLYTMLTGAASLAGTGAAGIIIAAFGIPSAMFIDVLTFLIAAVLIGSMRYGKEQAASDEPLEERDGLTGGAFHFFAEGVRYVVKSPVVRNFCILAVVLNFMLIPINALQAPIAGEIFKRGGELLSIAGAFGAIGGIVGSALLPFFSQKLSPLKITCIGTLTLGIGILGIACGGIFSESALASYVIAGGCFFIMTTAASLMGGVLNIQFMKSVDQKYIARAAGVMNAAGTASMPVGSMLVSFLVVRVSTVRILLFSVGFAFAVLAVIALRKPVLEVKEEAAADAA
ncbi:MAG: MFS transporter [Lachnospiraceae bacterium]|nr:MFS transporter [Lachnospiraceae bacterium]